MAVWVEACDADEIDRDDVIRPDHSEQTFAICWSPDGEFFASDGLRTHEKVHLADGHIMDDIIECPEHTERFNYKTGEPRNPPVSIKFKCHRVNVDGGKDHIQLG